MPVNWYVIVGSLSAFNASYMLLSMPSCPDLIDFTGILMLACMIRFLASLILPVSWVGSTMIVPSMSEVVQVKSWSVEVPLSTSLLPFFTGRAIPGFACATAILTTNSAKSISARDPAYTACVFDDDFIFVILIILCLVIIADCFEYSTSMPVRFLLVFKKK